MNSSKLVYGLKVPLLAVLMVSFLSELNARPYQSISPLLIAKAEQVTRDRFRVATSTPRGVTVIAVTAPRDDVLVAIDQGFTELFAVARRHGYQNHLSFSDYIVFIGRADRTKNSSGQYSP